MYFYYLQGWDSTTGETRYPSFFVQPFVKNDIIFDENNIPQLKIGINGINVNYLAINSPYTIMVSNRSYSSCDKHGFPYLVSSKSQINSEYLALLNSNIINGKYKKNHNHETFPSREFFIGFTIPIKYSRTYNNKTLNFKYLTVSSYDEWNVRSSSYNSSKTYMGSYSTPNVITSAPQDFSSIELTDTTDLILDFGNNDQEVPDSFYDWFLKNFEKVYENTYTIKSVTGEALTTLTEAPPMISATLSAVGNAKYLTLKGENNTNYTMEWTSETPQGKIFAGLATSKGGSIVIPVGETSTINLTDSTDLYEVWQTYRPPTTTFDINLYKNSAEPNKVDKTAELSTVGTISGVLRQECSLIDPEIIIQYDKPPDFNYCYIENFGRYYYVENIVSMRQNLWRVRLRCDVLMTYKTQILNLNARIARQQYTYSYRQIDSEIPFTNDPEITVVDIPNKLNLGKPHYENILLTVVDNGT